MFKLLKLKVASELAEIKSQHKIEMNAAKAEIDALKLEQEKSNELKIREVTSLLKIEHQQKLAQLQLDKDRSIETIRQNAAEEVLRQKEQLIADSAKRLNDAMTKLHEEGNVTTKFIQEMSLKMLDHVPSHKSEMKFIGKVKADGDSV